MKLSRTLAITLLSAALATSSYASQDGNFEEVKKAPSLSMLKQAKQAIRKGKEPHGSVEDTLAGYYSAVEVIKLLPEDFKSGQFSYYKLGRALDKCIKKLSKSQAGKRYLEYVHKFMDEYKALFTDLRNFASEEKFAMDKASKNYRASALGLDGKLEARAESKTISSFTFGKKNGRSARRSGDKVLLSKAFDAFKDAVLAAPEEMQSGLYPLFKLQGAVKKSLSKLKKYGDDAQVQYQEALAFYDAHSADFKQLEAGAGEEFAVMEAASAAYRIMK